MNGGRAIDQGVIEGCDGCCIPNAGVDIIPKAGVNNIPNAGVNNYYENNFIGVVD